MSACLGKRAETWLAARLQSRPVSILARNYQCRLGEIDLVLDHQGQTIFVEVRCRSSHESARCSVTRHKRKRLVRAANHYLAHNQTDGPCRFDLVTLVPHGHEFICEWHADAFNMSAC